MSSKINKRNIVCIINALLLRGIDMGNIVVSFCIATFQRYEILMELVMEVLSVANDKFEVVICDNYSLDGSFEKIRKIKDDRVKIFRNEENLGSLANFCRALNHGIGQYLFYINDRDNVDAFKITKLISILEQIKKENVAFAVCSETVNLEDDYKIFHAGKEAILEFSCKIGHPTGYIFRRDIWHKINNRTLLFEKQCYGDYPYTQVCAIMAKRYNGAYIFGDICDTRRERIDFSKIKSGYYQGRRDKRLWYSPEVQWRELFIANKFLKKIHIDEDVLNEMLIRRYKKYLYREVIEYKDIISKPLNTSHYNLKISQNPFWVIWKSFTNGIYLWRRMLRFCIDNQKSETCRYVNLQTKKVYSLFLKKYWGFINV